MIALAIEMIEIPTLIWAIYIGISIAILTIYYNKIYLGSAIRAILQEGAIDEANAKSAEVLGFSDKKLILRAIERGILAKYIKAVKKDGELHYYVTEEDRVRVDLRYSSKGTDLYIVVISLVIFFLIALLASRYLPELIAMAGDLAS